jgi:hypothetical protein
MNFIAVKTKRIRYNIAKYILKFLTPKLFESISIQTFKANNIVFNKDIKPIEVRPAINFIANKFKNQSLIGLELGVKRGNNAKSILENLNIQKLYLVDLWLDYFYIPKGNNLNYIYVKQLFKNDNRVNIIKGNSLDFKEQCKELLDFVYIDADHSYKSTYTDIFNLIDLVKVNGVIAGHDIRINSRDSIYNPNGFCVYPAVLDFCTDYGYSFYIQNPDWLIIK